MDYYRSRFDHYDRVLFNDHDWSRWCGNYCRSRSYNDWRRRRRRRNHYWSRSNYYRWRRWKENVIQIAEKNIRTIRNRTMIDMTSRYMSTHTGASGKDASCCKCGKKFYYIYHNLRSHIDYLRGLRFAYRATALPITRLPESALSAGTIRIFRYHAAGGHSCPVSDREVQWR